MTEIVEDWSTVATWQWLAGGKTRRQPEVVAASGGGEEELDVLLPPLGTTSGDHIRRNMVFSSLRRTCVGQARPTKEGRRREKRLGDDDIDMGGSGSERRQYTLGTKQRTKQWTE